MSRRKRFLRTVSAALVAGAVAATVVVASGGSGEGAAVSAAKKGFTPGKIAGKWIGEWENTTFGSKGAIRANVQAKPGNKMGLLADFGGNVFGCEDPKGVPQTLSKGSGKNTWSASGFRLFKPKSPVFGELTLNYNFNTKALTGSGKAPPCNQSITFTIDGKLTPTTLTATVNIDLGFQTAVSKLSAKKQ